MTEQTESMLSDLRDLQAEIDALLADETNSLETLPGKVDKHNDVLAKLFDYYESESKSMEGAALEFLKATQAKIAHWTTQAIEVRDETRQNLLKLAQGRKARRQY